MHIHISRSSLSRQLGPWLAAVLVAGTIGLAGYLKFHHPTPARASVTTTNHASTTGSTRRTASVDNADSATIDDTTINAGLQQLVASWNAKQNFHASVVVRELDGAQRSTAYQSDATMVAASTYKLFVAYAVLHEVEQGTYTMNTKTRTGQTVAAALDRTITQSDNASAEGLGFLVGWDRVNQLAASVGATHTDINNYAANGSYTSDDKHTTAADLATIVTKLQQGTLLNAANTQLLLGLMQNQVWRERIPAGIPKGVVVADKPGWLANVQNDAGIVYSPHGTYVLVIMTNGSATQPLADLSQQVYTYLQS